VRLLINFRLLTSYTQQSLLEDAPFLRREQRHIDSRRPRFDGNGTTASTDKLVNPPL
jgi:hypothetical protein